MILLRHGQSEFNVAFNATRVDPGIPDPRLTEEGRRQARAAAVALAAHPVERLIASPYTRALETAEIVVAPMLIGASSQCAETTRMAEGFGKDADHPASSAVQRASSASGGAPWLR